MTVLVVTTTFTLLAMACTGLLLGGLAARRQARLSKRLLDLCCEALKSQSFDGPKSN